MATPAVSVRTLHLATDEAAMAGVHQNRVIMHVDLDAFYCQVEIRRLGLDPHTPMAVQQWNGLIAVNYPARAAGISRHDRADDALKKCPGLKLVHVETLDEHGVAREHPAMATDKVSLARYRNASWEIFKVLLRIAGEKCVEKASVDEAYVDMSHLVDRFIETGRVDDHAGPKQELFCPRRLPIQPVQLPAWGEGGKQALTNLLDADETSTPQESPLLSATSPTTRRPAIIAEIAAHEDWFVIAADGREVPRPASADDSAAYVTDVSRALSCDKLSDVRMAAGAIVASYIRGRVFREVGFTCSCGIACNKMLAKMGSGRNKPSKQTIVPLASIPALMQRLPLQKIRFLGGKLGTELVAEVLRHRAAAGPTPEHLRAEHLAGNVANGDDESDDENLSELEEEEQEDHPDGSAAQAFRVVGRARAWKIAGTEGKPQAAPADITARDAQHISLSRLRDVFGEETAMWVYRVVRGVDDSDITPRLKPKSLLAAKSFAASACSDVASAVRWLRLLCTELAQRLQIDEEQWHRQPKTLVLHYRRAGTWGEGGKSRSCPMPPKPRTADSLLTAATSLYQRAAEEETSTYVPLSGRAGAASNKFACTRLAVAASGFVDYGGSDGGAHSITSFFAPRAAAPDADGVESPPREPAAAGQKRPRSAMDAWLTSSSQAIEKKVTAAGSSDGPVAAGQAVAPPETQPGSALPRNLTRADDGKETGRGAAAAATDGVDGGIVSLVDSSDGDEPAPSPTVRCPICAAAITLPPGLLQSDPRAQAAISAHVEKCLQPSAKKSAPATAPTKTIASLLTGHKSLAKRGTHAPPAAPKSNLK